MRKCGDGSKNLLALETSKNGKKRMRVCARLFVNVYVCVCVRPLLGTHRLVNFQEGR